MYDVVIIDPASTEFNRGSFCYLPYIYYSYLKNKDINVKIIENFTISNIDSLPEAKKYHISLWSYPQLDICFVLKRFLKNNFKFFGYYPLIDHYKFPKLEIDNESIKIGIENYVDYFNEFSDILLSDCDMHLNKYSGQVYPLFTSYGCPNGCLFCPSTINCNKKRISLKSDSIKKVLSKFNNYKYYNIHFTDEDFFFNIDRAYKVLSFIKELKNPFQLISLGSVDKVISFIEKYGNDILIDSGMKLIEVGLETADDDLAKLMHKTEHYKYEKLASICKIDIFWLSLTFFPGETISSIRNTGKFLEKFGHNVEDLYDRIKTNSTVGGLGQFFQPYHGTVDYENLKENGLFLSDRPIRLIPSYVPNSFLNCKIKKVNFKLWQKEWFELYKVDHLKLYLNLNVSIKEIISLNSQYNIEDIIIYLALCSRLGIIE